MERVRAVLRRVIAVFDAGDAAVVLGVALVAYGVAQWSPPAAAVLVGLFLIVVGREI